MAAQNPQQEARSLRRWLRRRHPSLRKNGRIILLPQQMRCFGGRLLLSLPADFRPESRGRDAFTVAGTRSDLRMTVMQIQFRRPLHRISAIDLQTAFAGLRLPPRLPEVEHGFLRHSPTLTAVWDSYPDNEITVLHLIQVQQTVFLMLFRDISYQQETAARTIIYAASLGVQ